MGKNPPLSRRKQGILVDCTTGSTRRNSQSYTRACPLFPKRKPWATSFNMMEIRVAPETATESSGNIQSEAMRGLTCHVA